jgi:hypothetical protein
VEIWEGSPVVTAMSPVLHERTGRVRAAGTGRVRAAGTGRVLAAGPARRPGTRRGPSGDG